MPEMTIGHPTSPLVRRRLGSFLRRLRENHEPAILSKRAAEAAGMLPSQLGRVEAGEYRIKVEWLNKLLDLYGADDVTRAALTEAALDDPASKWWYTFRKDLHPAYLDSIACEATASSILTQNSAGIPGLLQCPSYASAIQQSATEAAVRANADLYFGVRMTRQQIITRPVNPTRIHAYVPEVAFLTRFPVIRKTLNDQARHLLALSEEDHVTIQMVTLDAPYGFWHVQSLNLYGFPEPWPKVANVEDAFGGNLTERTDRVRIAERRFDLINAVALSESESRKFLTDFIEKGA